MALEAMQEKYIPQDNHFFRDYYHYFIIGLIFVVFLIAAMVGVILFQVLNRPLPEFKAVRADGQAMVLTPFTEPNLMPDTILRWASKGAITAYTFDFVNYEKQVGLARSYFTEAGWSDYQNSISKLIKTIVQNQLFVTGVVSGTPVISSEGPLPGYDYAWRVQIPFLVTYQSANATSKQSYYVQLTIVKVPTLINPQGIGIDQFVMVQ
jgi:intracellular multiplication protein IcmL